MVQLRHLTIEERRALATPNEARAWEAFRRGERTDANRILVRSWMYRVIDADPPAPHVHFIGH
jgi:hypothetical protein